MRAIAMVGIVLLGVGACARSDSGSAAKSAAAAPAEVHFTTKDYAFQGPDTIMSGMTTLVLHNDGPSLHHLLLVRLEDGKTPAGFEAAMKALKAPSDMPAAWAVPAGGVNPPNPGADTRATLMIQPGNYAVVCLVDIPDHVPHVMKGMVKRLTVLPSKTPPAPAPASDLTLNLVDFAFVFATPPTAGHHVIKVENKGTQPHEFELIRLAPGKTVADLARWAQTYQGTPPGSSLGGAAPMAPGQVEYIPFDLTPGDYVALCFVLDAKTHKPHLAEGMVLPFSIT